MPSTDRDYEIAMLQRQLHRNDALHVGTVWTRGRAMRSGVAGEQLRVASRTDMRDEDSGELFFIVGYSRIGGPDVVAT